MQTEALRIEGFLDSPELTAIRLSLNFLFANVDNQLGRALYLRAILPFLPTHPCKLCRKFRTAKSTLPRHSVPSTFPATRTTKILFDD